MTTEMLPVERYLSDRFKWAAPGDQQEDAWLLRFCDNDVRDMIWTGPDAEAEAWAAWNCHAPGYNCYLFRLASLAATPQPSAPEGLVERVARLFHDEYKRLAPSFGYETRDDIKQFDPDSRNGRLMLATVASVLAAIPERTAEGERKAIVAWLRNPHGKGSELAVEYGEDFADAIERGAHIQESGDG